MSIVINIPIYIYIYISILNAKKYTFLKRLNIFSIYIEHSIER